MSDHEADVREVRAVYCAPPPHLPPDEAYQKSRQRLARFDRWLRRQRADDLRKAADNIDLYMAYERDDSEYRNAEAVAEAWLRLRADDIEAGRT